MVQQKNPSRLKYYEKIQNNNNKETSHVLLSAKMIKFYDFVIFIFFSNSFIYVRENI